MGILDSGLAAGTLVIDTLLLRVVYKVHATNVITADDACNEVWLIDSRGSARAVFIQSGFMCHLT